MNVNTNTDFTLTTFYTGWLEYQNHIKDAVASLNAEQLALRAGSGLRSVSENARHIIGTRIGWFTYVLKEEISEEIKAIEAWDNHELPVEKIPSGAELANALDKTWQMMSERLHSWNSNDMQQTFTDDWDGEIVHLSRAWIIFHLIEHDLHHGGELSLTLGMHGIPASFPG